VAKKKAPQPQYFTTVADMHSVPLEKLGMFCEDLRLWLSIHRLAEAEAMRMTTPADTFGWVDDGKHDVKLNIKICNY
jgi:hypothetical protein